MNDKTDLSQVLPSAIDQLIDLVADRIDRKYSQVEGKITIGPIRNKKSRTNKKDR